MDKAAIPLLIGITSILGYLFARRWWGADCTRLVRAWHGAMEVLGCWVVVYFANLLLGATFILLFRLLTGFFISLYVLGSVMLALFSVLQALVFYHLWRQSR